MSRFAGRLTSGFPTAVCGLGCLLLAACATTPTPSPPTDTERRQQSSAPHNVAVARAMLGKPYRYGGTSPAGFDCSGLVYYSYRRAGIEVPRTTLAQYRRSRPVEARRARPGDLVFFRLTSKRVSHVGIYTGNGRFIHAPSSGKRVTYASLANPYWQQRMAGFRRIQ